jgi:sugar O-acyltransferase (sialic acid O-acetyltransferase NeuD family)
MTSIKENIVLVGGGGHCSSVIDVIEQQGIYRIAGIIDLKEKIGQKNLGYSIIGCDDDLTELAKIYGNFIITVGQIKTPQRRIEIYKILCELFIHLPVIISPLAYVSKHAKIGKGTVIMHMAQVNANTEVGDNCIINSKALLEHDVYVGNNCHISTGAIINGGTRIGESSFVGSGSILREKIEVPAGSFIKANSLVK